MRRAVAAALAVACTCALGFAASGCGASSTTKAGPAESAAPAPPPMRTLADVVASETPSLLAIPGVMAVREGLTEAGDPCIIVFVDKVTADMRQRIPTRLQNVPVVIEPISQMR